MPRIAPFVLLTAVATWLSGPAASAQDDVKKARIAEAREYFETGKESYADGQFGVAARAFKEAYERAPRSAILFSWAQALRRQYAIDLDPKTLEQAIARYRQYIAEVPKGGRHNDAVQHLATLTRIWDGVEKTLDSRETPRAPAATELMIRATPKDALASIDGDDKERAPLTRAVDPGTHQIEVSAPGYFTEKTEGIAVEGRLILVSVDLKPKPALVKVRAPAGSAVTVDGRRVGRSEAEVPAGRHVVTVTQRGHDPFARELELARGESITVEAALQTSRQRKVSYFFFGGAGLLALVGGATALLAVSAQSDAGDIRAKRDVEEMNLTHDEYLEYNRLLNQRDELRAASYATLGGVLAVGVTGALLYWLDNPSAESAASGSLLVPTVGEDSVGAAIVGSFE